MEKHKIILSGLVLISALGFVGCMDATVPDNNSTQPKQQAVENKDENQQTTTEDNLNDLIKNTDIGKPGGIQLISKTDFNDRYMYVFKMNVGDGEYKKFMAYYTGDKQNKDLFSSYVYRIIQIN